MKNEVGDLDFILQSFLMCKEHHLKIEKRALNLIIKIKAHNII